MSLNFPLEKITKKVLNTNNLDKFLNENWWNKIICINGCFDLLHYWHLYYLAEIKKLGDILIVWLNSDASVSAIKGTHRPINNQISRLYQIASLEYVDGVIIFEDNTPINLIKKIKPHILVKGWDYKKEEVVWHEIVEGYGGLVYVASLLHEYSTSALEKKILNSIS